MPTNRELLIAQRKKQTGFQTPATVATTPSSSRRTGRPLRKTTGFQGKEQRAADVVLKEGLAIPGMKTEGSALTKEFPLLRAEEQALSKSAKASGLNGTSEIVKPDNVTELKAKTGLGGATGTPRAGSFGLPSDRMPSFAELGGAIGQMFKFVSGLGRKREALGLIPGKVTQPNALLAKQGLGLTQKNRADILLKQHEAALLSGDEDKAANIEAELDKILNPAGTEQSDIEEILK